MGPIAYQLQPPIMVLVDCTGESGLAGIDAAVRERGDKLAVPVLGGSSPAVRCSMTFFPTFPLFLCTVCDSLLPPVALGY